MITPDDPEIPDGETALRPRAVFLSDFAHFDLPFDELAPVLCDPAAGWLRRIEAAQTDMSGLAGESENGLRTVVLRLGPLGSASRSAALLVAVTVGVPRRHAASIIIPMSWVPVALGQLLPTLEADLELSGLDSGACRLALSGRYRVPLGPLGLGLDRLGLHRVAEATVRQFLLDVQRSLLPV